MTSSEEGSDVSDSDSDSSDDDNAAGCAIATTIETPFSPIIHDFIA